VEAFSDHPSQQPYDMRRGSDYDTQYEDGYEHDDEHDIDGSNVVAAAFFDGFTVLLSVATIAAMAVLYSTRVPVSRLMRPNHR
jgi:hypothetical protein